MEVLTFFWIDLGGHELILLVFSLYTALKLLYLGLQLIFDNLVGLFVDVLNLFAELTWRDQLFSTDTYQAVVELVIHLLLNLVESYAGSYVVHHYCSSVVIEPDILSVLILLVNLYLPLNRGLTLFHYYSESSIVWTCDHQVLNDKGRGHFEL